MKTRIIIFTLLILGLFTACYEDKSNMEIKVVNPLVIDLGGASTTLSAYLLDTLVVAPVVYKRGVEDADLSFKWEISGNEIVPQVLDTTMVLKAVIGVPAKAEEYTLLFTVTDNTTSLQNYEVFKVKVSAQLGKGLLVADTKDEMDTDLNLVVAANFVGGVFWPPFSEKNTATLTAVYSQCNNGQLLNGLVTQMLSPGIGNNSPRTLTVITNGAAYRMDPYDYLLQGVNTDFFYVHPSAGRFKPEQMTFDNTMYFETMVLDGVVYARDTRWGNYNYGAPLETSDFSDYEVHKGYGFENSVYPNSYQLSYFYDELNDRFLECDNAYTQLTVKSNMKPNLGKQKPLYMSEGDNGLVYTVFKAAESPNYLLYTFTPASLLGAVYTPGLSYRLNSCADIANALQFESSRNEKVLYYRTQKKVYAALLTQENPVAHECFDVNDLHALNISNPQDEEITSILLWKTSGQGTITVKQSDSGGEPAKIASQYRMMVVTLWNPLTREGKIITIPIMNVGAGVLEKDSSYWKLYSGFGRILCVAPQSW